jgi:ArsR family transcriptional regulator, virulence genes transcriptional regulator
MTEKYNLEIYRLKAEVSKTFSDPKRLIIITELRDGEKTVTELVEGTGIAQAVLSRQLGILRTHGIVKPRRDGNKIFYRISDIRICQACDIVHEVLMDQLAGNREVARKLLK